jgi:uncharacterized protein YndB with AHSA1/START domain
MSAPEFTISRTFDAPRQRVWDAWTQPEQMAKWWGPKGFTVVYVKMDLRAGGTYLYCIRSPEGIEMWGKFEYSEVSAPQRLVFANFFSDANGGVTRHPYSPNWPLKTHSTVEFDEQDGKTTLTLRWSPINATEIERKTFEDGMASMQQGWGGTFEQLAAYVQAG